MTASVGQKLFRFEMMTTIIYLIVLSLLLQILNNTVSSTTSGFCYPVKALMNTVDGINVRVNATANVVNRAYELLNDMNDEVRDSQSEMVYKAAENLIKVPFRAPFCVVSSAYRVTGILPDAINLARSVCQICRSGLCPSELSNGAFCSGDLDLPVSGDLENDLVDLFDELLSDFPVLVIANISDLNVHPIDNVFIDILDDCNEMFESTNTVVTIVLYISYFGVPTYLVISIILYSMDRRDPWIFSVEYWLKRYPNHSRLIYVLWSPRTMLVTLLGITLSVLILVLVIHLQSAADNITHDINDGLDLVKTGLKNVTDTLVEIANEIKSSTNNTGTSIFDWYDNYKLIVVNTTNKYLGDDVADVVLDGVNCMTSLDSDVQRLSTLYNLFITTKEEVGKACSDIILMMVNYFRSSNLNSPNTSEMVPSGVYLIGVYILAYPLAILSSLVETFILGRSIWAIGDDANANDVRAYPVGVVDSSIPSTKEQNNLKLSQSISS